MAKEKGAKDKDKKDKPAKISDKEAEKIIIDYLEKQNRPYNSQTLIDNLHGTVGKSQANKVLQALCDSNKLFSKEFGKAKLFWRVQEGLEIDKEGMNEIVNQVKELENEKSPLSEEYKKLASEVSELMRQPSNQEAEKLIEKLTAENEELKSKYESITQNTVVITPQEKKKAEKTYDDTRSAWGKRKKMCDEVCAQLYESSGKRFKDFKEDLGLEDDDDNGVSLKKDDETTKMKKGEL